MLHYTTTCLTRAEALPTQTVIAPFLDQVPSAHVGPSGNRLTGCLGSRWHPCLGVGLIMGRVLSVREGSRRSI